MIRILFVGNSHTYVNDLPLSVKNAAENEGYECEVTMLAHGGWFLAQHAAEPDVRFQILNGKYDYVVLQEHSHPFAPKEKYEDAVHQLAEMIKQSGAVPVIYATWAQKSEPQVQKYMDEVNAGIAENENALLAPVGTWWWEYMKNHPDTEMYAPDGQHASAAGSAFAAEIIWARISEDLTEKRLDGCRHLVKAILEKAEEKERVIVTVDGPCASGKTTLAGELAECLDAALIHTDEFVIPHALKTPYRLSVPGANCDSSRLVKEVLKPYSEGREVIVRRYSCREQIMLEGEPLRKTNILIVEGSYCNLPEIREYADVRAYVNTKDYVRYRRLEKREDEKSLERFYKKWIPLENAYFSAYGLPDNECIIVNGDYV